MSGLFLHRARISEINERVRQGREPWASAYQQLLAAAEQGLSQAPLSVQQNGGSPHFRQDSVYIPGRDGVRNPEANTKNSEAASLLSRTCVDLALAWRFTGETRYADKALDLIHTWCINRNTYMFPFGGVFDAWTPGLGFGGDIVAFIGFHDLFLAGYLLDDYPGWNLDAHAAVKRWVKAMIDPQRPPMFYQGREMYNNWDDARLMYLAKGALMLGDLDLLSQVFQRWTHTLSLKMTEQGELHRETMRTRSMHYTLFALNSTVQIAEIARQHGVDLYGVTINGRTLRTAVDYATHYLLHLDEWPFEMIEPMTKDGPETRLLSLFEMVYARWDDPRYLQVIETYARRPLAGLHATLLFAEK